MTKICLIASNELEAYRFARSQNLEKDQYFYPSNINELFFKQNFHVIVVGNVAEKMPSALFEKIYSFALERGKIGRV